MPDIVSARPTSGAPIASAWGDEVHDALEGIQYGTVTVNMGGTAAAVGAITFPRAYASPPTVVAIPRWQSGYTNMAAMIQGTPNVAGASVRCMTINGSTASQSVVCDWIAIGVPA